MSKFKLYLTILLCTLSGLSVLADSEGDKKDYSKLTIPQKRNNNLPTRPNAPSHIFIECEYGDGFMKFLFPDGIYSLSVRIYNELDNWWGIATTEESYIEIPSFNGEYIIECTSDDGRIFSGEIFF
ncbi:MAG: hypothetical protein K2K26_11930 [Muribaculaceae bacterium]|nr:hypothetical protein [Muribaculaceae bacterium]